MVCGGKARDFFGEYMAGGLLVLLGMNSQFPDGPSWAGTRHRHARRRDLPPRVGRGRLVLRHRGQQVSLASDAEKAGLRTVLADYCRTFAHGASTRS